MKCFLFFHKWDICVCTRCGATRHVYNPPHDHICDRGGCHHVNPNIYVHQFNYSARGTERCYCTKCLEYIHAWKKCKCVVCGEVRDIEHDMDGCICRNCGTVFHVFGSTLHNSNCQDYKVCEKCGKTEILRISHIYKMNHSKCKTPCHIYKECIDCGHVIEEYNHHLEFHSNGESDSDYARKNYICTVCGEMVTKMVDNNSDW